MKLNLKNRSVSRWVVIPSAIEALSGDRKTFESAKVVFTSLSRRTPKALDAPTIVCSMLVRARGSWLMIGGGPEGPAGSEQAVTTIRPYQASR